MTRSKLQMRNMTDDGTMSFLGIVRDVQSLAAREPAFSELPQLVSLFNYTDCSIVYP
jgi:hypothetical protein